MTDTALAAARHRIAARKLEDEAAVVQRLADSLEPAADLLTRASTTAVALIEGARTRRSERGKLDAFLAEFGLGTSEGVALMCLAEALLRVPDADTADRLIAEKISSGRWDAHLGRSDSVLVNASTWALLLTGRVVEMDPELSRYPPGWFGRLVNRLGEPVIRQAVRQAMRIMGGEFVMGQTIEQALARSRKEPETSGLCSFDMLGEGARTDTDAARYAAAYRDAIAKISLADQRGEAAGHGISVKLSALDPRYHEAHRERTMARLYPVLLELAQQAALARMQFTIDAEEADRLELSLDIIERLAHDTDPSWSGLAFAMQAYGKRAFDVVDWAAALARRSGRRMAVRLVKGAYWDTEIKRAQELGLPDYPVFTRKVSTDLSYIACAKKMLANRDALHCAFATHNAHTLAAILALAGQDRSHMEFQRLHGMGDLLYAEAQRQIAGMPPVRVYAPVGAHRDLLAYLVRRLLENGANSSFVNRFMDLDTPPASLARDPCTVVRQLGGVRHPNIPLPKGLYGEERANSSGRDLSDRAVLAPIAGAVAALDAQPVVRGHDVAITAPHDRRIIVGHAPETTQAQALAALDAACTAQAAWDALGGHARADILLRAADLMEARLEPLVALLSREAGKTLPDSVAEVREAVDFCRYYAARTREDFGAPKPLPGPTGETNQLSLHGKGVFLCISPWNFPLAIFTGQVAAALAAGNTVLAKPAETTPLIAFEAVRLLHEAGVPKDVLHLLPGSGPALGGWLLPDDRVAGVAFTGSTATAQRINRALANRDGPIATLIAETGGQNAMIVDSTALPEQVVDDVIASAFLSAGQRCSALRVLCLQDDIADTMIAMIAGAMDTLVLGDPSKLSSDIGPVISQAAADGLMAHIARMRETARILKALPLGEAHAHGSFVAPHLIEIGSIKELTREEFGPILHVLRYPASGLDALLADIRATGYGLTMGVHSRLEGTARRVFAASRCGNTYINRSMTGAVVGVQPFGGAGLSGTGPKAGGPYYLHRFASERTYTVNVAATGGNTQLFTMNEG